MYTITVIDQNTNGMDYQDCINVYFGEVSPWHETESAAQSAMNLLETTGDWPEGRPSYRIIEGYNAVPW
jgi:hypothetical protein